jgi:hypothetical protein
VKTLAIGAAAVAAEQGAEHGLRAAGADETAVRGFRLAVAVVSMIIWRRRFGSATDGQRPPSGAQPPSAPQTKPPARPSLARPDAPKGSLKNRSGDLDEAARAARTQPHGAGSVPAVNTSSGKPLRVRMGAPPKGMKKPEAHHDLPKAFREEFEKRGLDIEDPAYGRWVEGGPIGGHQKWSKEFEMEWKAFFRMVPNAKKAEILDKMNQLRRDTRFQ